MNCNPSVPSRWSALLLLAVANLWCIKRLTKSRLGFFSFETVRRKLRGHEVMNMFRKGQMQGVKRRNILRQVLCIACLFGVMAKQDHTGHLQASTTEVRK